MKLSKFVFLFAVATLGLVSCKKDEVKPNLSGAWQGSWGFGTDAPSYYEKWTLEKNGDLSSYFLDGTIYANGTWELNGNDFEAHYKPISENYTYTFTGTLQDGNDQIRGDWKENDDPTNGGTFKMNKQD